MTTYTIQEDLRHRFQRENEIFIYKIAQELTHCYQGNDIFATYHTKLKGLQQKMDSYDESITCDATNASTISSKRFRKRKIELKFFNFFQGAMTSFPTLDATFLPKNHFLSQKAFSIVIHEEKMTQSSKVQSTSIHAFHANKSDGSQWFYGIRIPTTTTKYLHH